MSTFTLRAFVLCGLVLLVGCPNSAGSKSASTPPVGGSAPTSGSSGGGESGRTAAAARPSSVAEVLVLEGEIGRRTLTGWARDEETPVELRLLSLRRLEELKAPETVPLASDLARLPGPRLLRENAVAVLVRAKTPEAQAALGSLDAAGQTLARSLGGGA